MRPTLQLRLVRQAEGYDAASPSASTEEGAVPRCDRIGGGQQSWETFATQAEYP